MGDGLLHHAPILFVLAAVALAPLAGCGAEPTANATDGTASTAATPTDTGDAYDGLGEDERVDFTGTEPFWGGHVESTVLTYQTPEDSTGKTLEVERFTGRGGVSYSGLLDGAEFTMTITPLTCSDGMSDRSYPFTVTAKIGEETRNGCGWTKRQPFEGPEHP